MDLSNDDILQLRFEGNGINPDKVLPSEISELITEFENALLCTIKDTHPEIDTKILLFSLKEIKNESLGIHFKTLAENTLPDIRSVVVSSYMLIATSIQTSDYSHLGQGALQSLKKLSNFSKKHQCNGQFIKNGETISVFTPKTEIKERKPTLIRSDVTIYGEVTDIGSNIHLKLNEGYTVIFDVDKQTSKLLSSKLWEQIGVRGVAKWDVETFRITEFKLSSILDYSQSSISETFAQLRNITSDVWDKLNNDNEINNQLLRD